MSMTLFSAIFKISILFSFRWLIEVVRPRKAELNLFSNGDNPSLSLWCFRIMKICTCVVFICTFRRFSKNTYNYCRRKYESLVIRKVTVVLPSDWWDMHNMHHVRVFSFDCTNERPFLPNPQIHQKKHPHPRVCICLSTNTFV